MTHECVSSDHLYPGCSCSMASDDPSDNCPVHGGGEWPPKCGICGRYMRWEEAHRMQALGERTES